MSTPIQDWTLADTRRLIRVPSARDDKYRRGVLGVRTGSALYPGAAVLSVEAALHTGIGMVRYLGQAEPAGLVLARRPEVVTAPGRVQTLLLGSGMPPVEPDGPDARALTEALAAGIPAVLDAGALPLVHSHRGAALVITPHAGELAQLLAAAPVLPHEVPGEPTNARAWIEDNPEHAASIAAALWDVTVVVKGSLTIVADPHGHTIRLPRATPWLASAGSGDVLAGAIAALVAGVQADSPTTPGHRHLAQAAAAGAHLHALAAERASAGGPLLALDLARALAPTVAAVLSAQDG